MRRVDRGGEKLRRAKRAAVEWDQIGQETFDRIVEAAVYAEYPDADVRPIEGRGGDGGIDILVTDGEQTIIFQLKYLPEGFAGPWRDRRRQISRSFDSALVHPLTKWVLVVPCKLTRSDWAFIGTLTEQSGVPITVWHRAALDRLMAKHPDLADFLQRDDYLFEKARVFQQEKAVLMGGVEDLHERVAEMGRLVDSVDPHWTLDFERVGSATFSTIRAKHPAAAQLSPITLRVGVEFGEEDQATATAFQRAMDYGSSDRVVLPPRLVHEFVVDGPEFPRGDRGRPELTFIPAGAPGVVGKRFTLALLDADGNTIGSHTATATHGGFGSVGYSLDLVFYGTLKLGLRLPSELTEPMTLDYSFTPEGDSVRDVARAARLSLDLVASRSLMLSADDGTVLTRGHGPDWRDRADPAWIKAMQLLNESATDLAVVQEETNTHFPMPDSLSVLDRIHLRMLRLILEGKCTWHPQLKSFEAVLVPREDLDEGTAKLLSGDPMALALTQSRGSVEVGGQTLPLPTVTYWHPAMRLENADEARSCLMRGQEASVRVVSDDDTNFRVYVQGRVSDPNAPLAPAPWGLTEVHEVGAG